MDQIYLKNVVSLEYEPSKCTGCGLCIDVCPHRVFRMEKRKVVIERLDACMECGACALNCKTEALTVNSGVGCATAVIYGFIRKTEPACGCDGSCS